MKKIILLFTLFSLNLVHSQNDIRAEKLLNSVSEKIDSSETFKINFTYTLENLIENINQDSDGSIVIKDDNYLLEFMGIKQLCDSKKVYSIVPENEEIIISNIDEDESEADMKTRIRVTYEILQSTAKMKFFRPCYKRYLTSHIEGRALEITPDYWDIMAMLPVARFEKESIRKVYSESIRSFN